ISTLSCAENLFIGVNMRRRKLVSWTEMRRQAREICAEWGLAIDPDAPAGCLTVGQRQLLEIAKALTQGSRFVILDEPTAKLDVQEAHRLFEHLRVLQRKGVGILYISHHLEEIFDICSTVTVLRDGHRILDRPIAGLERSELLDAMVGPAGAPVAA